MNTQSVVVIILGVIVVVLGWAVLNNRKTEAIREKEKINETPSPMQPSPVQTAQSQVVAEKGKDSLSQFRERLKILSAQGKNFETAFPHALQESGDRISFDEALAEANTMNYDLKDLLSMMAKQNCSLDQIADFLSENSSLNTEDFIKTLAPFASGNSPKEKAQNVLDAMKNIWDFDDEGEVLIGSLTTLGCSKEEVAQFTYDLTSMSASDVAIAMKLSDSPAVVATIAKNLNVDLTDTDEYKTLRDDDPDFKTTVPILKACGKTATEIFDAENDYQEVELGDIKNIIEAFWKAGFKQEEVIEGIWNSDVGDDQSSGAIVEALRSIEIPLPEIVKKLIKEDVDPEELDSELSEENVDIRTRTEILHSLFESLDREKKSA